MTTVASRLKYEFPIALDSLLKQTTDLRINVYVADDEYQLFVDAKRSIPSLNDYRVSIIPTVDLKAAKKFIPAIKQYKSKSQILITVDDDFWYASQIIESQNNN